MPQGNQVLIEILTCAQAWIEKNKAIRGCFCSWLPSCVQMRHCSWMRFVLFFVWSASVLNKNTQSLFVLTFCVLVLNAQKVQNGPFFKRSALVVAVKQDSHFHPLLVTWRQLTQDQVTSEVFLIRSMFLHSVAPIEEQTNPVCVLCVWLNTNKTFMSELQGCNELSQWTSSWLGSDVTRGHEIL